MKEVSTCCLDTVYFIEGDEEIPWYPVCTQCRQPCFVLTEAEAKAKEER